MCERELDRVREKREKQRSQADSDNEEQPNDCADNEQLARREGEGRGL